MVMRVVACRRPACHRPHATRSAPSAARRIPVRHVASKPLLAYHMVKLPSVEILHEHLTQHLPTQAIVEDPHLHQIQLIPHVLENFADREMVHGMIKVELTMMLWSYKDLNLPDYVVKLLIDNLSDSLSNSTVQEIPAHLRPLMRENLRETKNTPLLSARPI